MMRTDTIKQVRIDEADRLCITPATEEFTLIYRAAIEVNWDRKLRCLHSPKPREWSYLRWFQQIVTGVESEYACSLLLRPTTEWKHVPPDLRADIENWMNERAEPVS